jgi:hypothetical protein
MAMALEQQIRSVQTQKERLRLNRNRSSLLGSVHNARPAR